MVIPVIFSKPVSNLTIITEAIILFVKSFLGNTGLLEFTNTYLIYESGTAYRFFSLIYIIKSILFYSRIP